MSWVQCIPVQQVSFKMILGWCSDVSSLIIKPFEVNWVPVLAVDDQAGAIVSQTCHWSKWIKVGQYQHAVNVSCLLRLANIHKCNPWYSDICRDFFLFLTVSLANLPGLLPAWDILHCSHSSFLGVLQETNLVISLKVRRCQRCLAHSGKYISEYITICIYEYTICDLMSYFYAYCKRAMRDLESNPRFQPHATIPHQTSAHCKDLEMAKAPPAKKRRKMSRSDTQTSRRAIFVASREALFQWCISAKIDALSPKQLVFLVSLVTVSTEPLCPPGKSISNIITLEESLKITCGIKLRTTSLLRVGERSVIYMAKSFQIQLKYPNIHNRGC